MVDPILARAVFAVFKLLDAEAIEYALIGGLAATIRGRVRLTQDVDFIIRCDQATAMRLLDRCREFGLEPMFDDVHKVVQQSFLLPLVMSDVEVGIDLSIGMTGFDEAIVERAMPVRIDETEIFTASVEDLLLMKLNAYRGQDLQDIEGLLWVNAGSIDWSYCRQMAVQLQEIFENDLLTRIEQCQIDERQWFE